MIPGKLRFNVQQFFLLAALCALLVGFGSAVWRVSNLGIPRFVALSPAGTTAVVGYQSADRMRIASLDTRLEFWDLSGERPRRLGSKRVAWELSESTCAMLNEQEVIYASFSQMPDAATYPCLIECFDVRQHKIVSKTKLREYPYHVLPTAQRGRVFVIGDGSIGARASLTVSRAMIVELGRTPTNAPGYWPGVRASSADMPAGPLPGQWFRIGGTDIARVAGNGTLVTAPVMAQGSAVGITRPNHGTEMLSFAASIQDLRVSPGGRWMALALNPSQATEYRIWNIQETPARFVTSIKSSGPTWGASFGFSGRNEEFYHFEEGTLKVFDAATGKPLSRRDARPPVDQIVVSADGDTTVGYTLDHVSRKVAVYDAELKAKHLLLQSNEQRHIVVFSLAFIGWISAWSWLVRRTRQRDLQAPQSDSVYSQASLQRSPVSHRAARRRLAIALILLLLASAWSASRRSGGSWFGFLWAYAGWIVTAIVGVFLLVVVIWFLIRLVFGGFYLQIQRLEQSASLPIRKASWDRVQAYFVGRSSLEGQLRREWALACQRFGQLFGEVPTVRRRVLIVVFEKRRDYFAYLGREIWIGGVYMGWFDKQLVLCDEIIQQDFSRAHQVLRSLYVYLLTQELKKTLLPPILSMLVNAWIQRDELRQRDVQSAHRRISVVQSVAEGMTCRQFLDVTPLDMKESAFSVQDRDGFRQFLHLLDLATSLSEFLLGEASPGNKSPEVIKLLAQLDRRSDQTKLLESHMGWSLDELAARWDAWRREQPVLIDDAPPPRFCDYARQTAIPALISTATLATDRARIVRSLGKSGLTAAAPEIIAQLSYDAGGAISSAEAELQADVLWTLRAISGENREADVASWREWFANLPPVAQNWPESLSPFDSAATAAPHLDESEQETLHPLAATVSPSDDAPASVVWSWRLLALGGAVAIVFSNIMTFLIQLYWNPIPYFGICVGCLALYRGLTRDAHRIRRTALLLMANVLNFDVVNFVIGIVVLITMRKTSLASRGK